VGLLEILELKTKKKQFSEGVFFLLGESAVTMVTMQVC
jgi:hypothetical protein